MSRNSPISKIYQFVAIRGSSDRSGKPTYSKSKMINRNCTVWPVFLLLVSTNLKNLMFYLTCYCCSFYCAGCRTYTVHNAYCILHIYLFEKILIVRNDRLKNIGYRICLSVLFYCLVEIQNSVIIYTCQQSKRISYFSYIFVKSRFCSLK